MSQIAFLPGNSVGKVEQKNMKQSMRYVNGYAIVQAAPVTGDITEAEPYDPSMTFKGVLRRPKNPKAEDGHDFDGEASVNKATLVFKAFFDEDIVFSREEKTRKRIVNLVYFMEDNTMRITEPRRDNSGLAQGVRLKRQQVPNDVTGELVVPQDLVIGNNVHFYAQKYHIFDCDDTARIVLAKLGICCGDAEKVDDDEFTQTRSLVEVQPRVHTYNQKDNLARFLDKDRHVLRFHCVWDNTSDVYGQVRKFVLHHFLVDSTTEVRSVSEVNTGREGGPVFVRRQKLPKKNFSVSDDVGEVECYTAEDLRIGAEIFVFGRRFKILSADEFTRQYLKEHYGDDTPNVEFESDVSVHGGEASFVPPPPTGFGSEEDSLASCINLVPKVPRKDYARALAKSGDVLRFTGTFNNPSAEDVDRSFIVSFFMADNTVLIFEPPVRNSGFKGGKFLERHRAKNDRTGTWVAASDLYVGCILAINGFEFLLNDADEYAFQYMERYDAEFPHANLGKVVDKLRPVIDTLKASFNEADKDKNGYLDSAEFTSAVSSIAPELSTHEIVTLMRRLDIDNNGKVTYPELLAMAQ
eukprot:TRINITY_DN41257_c0_g1_i1.p1 TRINITY_DN41257_c0_g1~~TRINITY_DN41257_c0_g1_i1.p1  ORF type:complete len:580 (-),score=165.85 TRINITY_DN41257_c0_g1_i1:31-1770(-)